MLEKLSGLWGKINLYVFFGLTVVILTLSGFIAYQRLEIKGQGASIVTLQKNIDDLSTNFLTYKQSAQETIDTLAQQAKEANERLAASRTREKEIRNVPKEQDGGVPPVMVDSLKRMQ